MLTYVVRRLLYAVLTFFGILVAVFLLLHSVPGDPIRFFLGGGFGTPSAAAIAAIRHEHHLDQPLFSQLIWWLRGVLTLDFGHSILDHRPVTEKILEQYEIFGHDRFLAQLSVGPMPHAELMRSIELLGTEVAPVVRDEVAKRRRTTQMSGQR